MSSQGTELKKEISARQRLRPRAQWSMARLMLSNHRRREKTMKNPTWPTNQEPQSCSPIDHWLGGARGLSDKELHKQNRTYSGSGGVSQYNRRAGFMPAYKNMRTGVAVVSRFADGSPAPVHVLEGLPDDWVASRDGRGNVRRVFSSVIAGFVRDGTFFTREAAARIIADENSR
jgi:hypothetical protein